MKRFAIDPYAVWQRRYPRRLVAALFMWPGVVLAGGDAGFDLGADFARPALCAPGIAEPVNVSVQGLGEFTDPVTLTVETAAEGIGAMLSTNPVVPGTSTELLLSADGTVPDGDYAIVVTGNAEGVAPDSLRLTLAVGTAPPPPAFLATPTDGALNQPPAPTLLSWYALPGATSYEVEVALDNAFAFVVTGGLAGENFLEILLESDETYHWRVRGANACGSGELSESRSFATGALLCAMGPVMIPDFARAPGDLSLVSAGPGQLTDVDVILFASHTSVGHLSFELVHEQTGTTVVLIDRPGFPASDPGCENDNIEVFLDDAATDAAEDECDPDPALFGLLRPNGLLADFNGENYAGTWTVRSTDHVFGQMGTLNEWCLVASIPPGADADFDGIADSDDNCIMTANVDQADSNGDRIGNACDADVTGPGGFGFDDCRVNLADLARFRAGFLGSDPDLDLNGPGGRRDGLVNLLDVAVVRAQFLGPPGPSAAGCN